MHKNVVNGIIEIKTITIHEVVKEVANGTRRAIEVVVKVL